MDLLYKYLLFMGFNLLSNMVQCIDYFERDHRMDAMFPPLINRNPPKGIPIGHLRSLGFQRSSDGSVKQLEKIPMPEEFYEKYVNLGKPVLLRELLNKDSTIVARWTDDYIKSKYGHIKIHHVQRHRKKPDVKPTRTTLLDFLENYKLKDMYMATTLPEEMKNEVELPNILRCGPASRNLYETELWLGYGGTGSLLHYHGNHQLHCQVDGRKDFIMIESKYKPQLKFVEHPPYSKEGQSTIDTEMVNMFQEPQLANVAWNHATLFTGDCLYIPADYVHQVRSYGRSLSYTIQFLVSTSGKGSNNKDDWSDCTKTKLQSGPLSQFEFIWTSRNGVDQLFNKDLTADTLRKLLLQLAQQEENVVLTSNRFTYYYDRAMGKKKTNRGKIPGDKVFSMLDKSHSGKLSVQDITACKSDDLHSVANILNSAHEISKEEL